jgi:hypothetical protein
MRVLQPDYVPINEKSSLLRAGNSSASLRSLGAWSTTDHGDFSKESIGIADMKRTTHNDPDVAEIAEDMSSLVGSTRILYNEIEKRTADKLTASLRKMSGGSLPSSPLPVKYQRAYNHRRQEAVTFLEKVKTTFFEDAKSLAVGTIPQSVVVAFVIGTICGIACWIYYSILFFMLDFLWETLPQKIVVGHWKEENHWLWIPIVSVTMIVLVGLTVKYMGEPGDLPYTVSRVHHFAYIPVDHVFPMVFASLFSILAGGSL